MPSTLQMTPARIDAIVATAYNVKIGVKVGGDAMTPDKAAELTRGDRYYLLDLLATEGGSDLYTQEDAQAAKEVVLARGSVRGC